MFERWRTGWIIPAIRSLAIAALTAAQAGAVAPALAATGPLCYVNQAAAGANNGNSWANAFTSLQSALKDANCTQIWVAKGVYKPTNTTKRSKSFVVKEAVEVYGGFKGNETLLAQRDPWKNRTILSGDIDNNDVNADGNQIAEAASQINGKNSYHVVTMDGSTSDLTTLTKLSGFTITAGDSGSGSPDGYAGGLYCVVGSGWCSPNLEYLTFSGNHAQAGGALALVTDAGGVSNPYVSHSTFIGNFADNLGGAIYNLADGGTVDPTVWNSTFVNNNAGEAPAIYVWAMNSGTAAGYFTNLTLVGNGDGFSGSMFFGNGSGGGGTCGPTLTNVILWDNDLGASPPIGFTYCSSSVSYSVIQGGFAGSNISSADPFLKPLGYYGGANQTMPPLLNSVAVDSGDNVNCPLDDQRGFERPQEGVIGNPQVCDRGATEAYEASMTFRSRGLYDGRILESGPLTSVGGSLNTTSSTLRMGDDAQNRQYRSILSFNTSALPDDGEIFNAAVSIREAALEGDTPYLGVTPDISIQVLLTGYKPAKVADFDFGGISPGDFILSVPVDGWYSSDGDGAIADFVDPLGYTKLRIWYGAEDDGDNLADYLSFYSGDAGKSKRPKFVVTYHAP